MGVASSCSSAPVTHHFGFAVFANTELKQATVLGLWTETGSEHLECQDTGIPQMITLIVRTRETVLYNIT